MVPGSLDNRIAIESNLVQMNIVPSREAWLFSTIHQPCTFLLFILLFLCKVALDISGFNYFLTSTFTQSAGAVKYTDCFSAEG